MSVDSNQIYGTSAYGYKTEKEKKEELSNKETSNRKSSLKAQEDLKLVRQAIDDNDESAYAKLLQRYRDSIYYMILKMVHKKEDAEDLTIEAFGKAFNKIHNYDPKYAFSTWLFKIAVNNCIDFIRKKRLDCLPLDEPKQGEEGNYTPGSNIASAEPDPYTSLNKAERKVIVQKVVNQLPDNYKALITLRYFKEYSYDEIAKELNLPLGTVKAQLFRGKQLIESIFKNYGNRYKF